MKNIKKGTLSIIALLIFVASSMAVSAATDSIAGTDLYFDGGQTGTHVYSDIWDTNTSNSQKWKVNAIVKVCSNTTQSGFKDDSASIREARSFWCNETSHYDYYARN
ncbi:hypothetical protein [Lysinibacillus piscis]|uniref:Secreted protein n=1 Tax=Lysinibacillus piscis TaxID=2518931 RepID=A0ABQ5NM55_9BACI|nr:hypothetical protein [Lysinibacillus sp. KH24]GLC89197.1 hypothetical protein LYSBPC_23240 [Lysinibacillus sp. KH24]